MMRYENWQLLAETADQCSEWLESLMEAMGERDFEAIDDDELKDDIESLSQRIGHLAGYCDACATAGLAHEVSELTEGVLI